VAGVLVVTTPPADASLIAQRWSRSRLEGVIAKRRASTYRLGVISADWVKSKRAGWQEGRTWGN